MLVVLLGVLASIFLSGSAAGSVPVYRTVVSLTFDDGRISQWTTRDLLKNHGMNATFYLNSGTVDTSGFLSWAQVNSLAADGNEIGGHTIDHPHLTLIPSGDARAEICDDRTALIAHGFAMSSFAYPFGESNPAVEALAAECGYTSARITTGILGSAPWCNTPTEHCPTAETIPPWNPYNIRATGSVTNTTTLAELESFVTSAEQNGGGWLPFVFHDIGGGAEYSISETDFTAFLDWLSLRRSKGTIVRTVGEVMNGSVNPPPPGPNLLQNPSFEIDTNTDGVPDCWTPSQWGANDGSWTEITSDHTPGTAIKGVITSWTSGERRFMVDRSSQCAPPVTPGHSYHVTGWYKGTLPPYLAVFWDDGSGSFSLGSADSPDFPVSSGWHEISWTTPPAPAGATALSIALTIAGATGDITIDDFSLGDAAGTPPHVQISAPTAGNYVSGTTAFTASASDDHGVQSLEFFVDDKPVGEDTGTPYSLGWDSTTTSGGAHTLTVLATDLDGAQSYDSLGFFVDNTDPTGSLTAPAPGSFLRGSVALSSDSADAGSGVASVSFQRSPAGAGSWTEIASDATSPYGAGWDTSAVADGSYELRVVTSDSAGNSHSSASVSVTVDNTPPTGSLTAPAPGSFLRGSVALSSDSADAGSGVASVSFQRSPAGAGSWTEIASDATSPYGAGWDTSAVADGSYELRVVTSDSAGNSHSSAPVSVTVDNTDPTGSLTAPAPGSFLRGSVALSSDSADAGSGVASVSFQRSPAGAGSWTEIASDATSPYGAGWNTSAVADGSYELRVVTSDSAGNSHTSAPVSVTVDNTDPTGSLTRPGTNVFVKREVAVSSDSADPTSGVAWVAFEIAPSSYGPWQTAATVTSAPWSASVRFPKMAQGRYYVRAVTSDRAGNTFVSQTRRIGLDNTAPTSSIACNGKQGCRTVYFKSVYVAFSAYDRGSGVRAIRYTTNGKIPTASSSLYRRPLKLKKSMVVRWRVWDRAGNVSLTWSRAIKVSAPHRAH